MDKQERTINAIWRLLRGGYYNAPRATLALHNRAGLTMQAAEQVISIWTRTGELRRVIYRGARLVAVQRGFFTVPALIMGMQEGDSRLVLVDRTEISVPRHAVKYQHDYILTKEIKGLIDDILD